MLRAAATKAAKWRVVEREARQTVVEDVDLEDEEVEPRKKAEAEILLREGKVDRDLAQGDENEDDDVDPNLRFGSGVIGDDDGEDDEEEGGGGGGGGDDDEDEE